MNTAAHIMGLDKLCGLYNIIRCNGGLAKLLRQLYRANNMKCTDWIEEALHSTGSPSECSRMNSEENCSFDAALMPARLLRWMNYLTNDCKRPCYHWMPQQTDYPLNTSYPYYSHNMANNWQPRSNTSIILQLRRSLSSKHAGLSQTGMQLKNKDQKDYKYPCPVIDNGGKKKSCKTKSRQKNSCNNNGKGKKRESIKDKKTKNLCKPDKAEDSCSPKKTDSCTSVKVEDVCGAKTKDPCKQKAEHSCCEDLELVGEESDSQKKGKSRNKKGSATKSDNRHCCN